MGVTGRRGTVLLAIGAVLALGVAAFAVARPWSDPPAATSPEQLQAWQQRRAEDALLRERLGALAAVVVDDPPLAGCAETDAQVGGGSAGEVGVIQAQVEQLRGLELPEPADVRLLDDEEMTARVEHALERQWDDQRVDIESRLLTALGAVPPGTDLAQLRVEMFAEQVSGMFSPTEEVIAVRNRGAEGLSPLERVVLAHEIEHALTSEHLGRPETGSGDAQLARAALVEGSAVLAMRQYAHVVLTDQERGWLRADLLAMAHRDPLAGYSPYLRDEVRFPYLRGVRFACQRWHDGGWEAVNEAYADPPESTAAVLFPQRAGEAPREPGGLGGPGVGWEQVRSGDFGAAQLRWLVAAPGGDRDSAVQTEPPPVEAWDGGEVVLWTRGEDTAVGLALADRGEGPPLCDTLRSWYAAAFPQASPTPGTGSRTGFVGDAQQAVLSCEDELVRLGIAPEREQALAIADKGWASGVNRCCR